MLDEDEDDDDNNLVTEFELVTKRLAIGLGMETYITNPLRPFTKNGFTIG